MISLKRCVFTQPRSNPDIMPPEPNVRFRQTTKETSMTDLRRIPDRPILGRQQTDSFWRLQLKLPPLADGAGCRFHVRAPNAKPGRSNVLSALGVAFLNDRHDARR